VRQLPGEPNTIGTTVAELCAAYLRFAKSYYRTDGGTTRSMQRVVIVLYILGTLERPTSGSVRLGGDDPFARGEAALAAFRNRTLGFVFQDHHLLPQCSVLENVLLPTIADGASPAGATERAKMLLDRVGLSARLAHRPAELSGGERQRVAIARALINRPALVLADEPTGNLDRTTAAKVVRVLLDLPREEQAMLVVVTHSLELAALVQRRMELDDGKLVDGK
jgi:lipoprotein-releasing system ATP-binding protein